MMVLLFCMQKKEQWLKAGKIGDFRISYLKNFDCNCWYFFGSPLYYMKNSLAPFGTWGEE